MKKYFIKVTDQYGQVIFNHSSDYPERLIKLYNKAAYDGDNMFASFYFGKGETNIPDEAWY